MNCKRFLGRTAREALARVREALGEDAVILSNRTSAQGVEILAVPGHDLDRIVGDPRRAATDHVVEAPAPTSGAIASPPSAVAPSASARPRTLMDFARVLRGAHADAQPVVPAMADLDDDDGAIVQLASRASNPPSPVAPIAANTAPPSPASVPADRSAPSNDDTRRMIAEVASQVAAQVVREVATQQRATPAPTPVAPAAPARVPETAHAPNEMLAELAALRGLVQEQLSELSWRGMRLTHPVRGAMLKELLGAGFSAVLARRVTDGMPDFKHEGEAREWVASVLVKNLRCASVEDDIVAKGGVYALVGPTGVGKTTTTAKLAARALVRYGAAKVALVSADNYRIGAQHQLEWYARVLGVPVERVRTPRDLAGALARFGDRKLVLVDTAGLSQRDNHVAEQLAMLDAAPLERIVLFNAASQAETLDDVARHFGPRPDATVRHAIVTKIDEAVQLGGVVDCAIRHRLSLQYIATGQRVPEDIHPAHGRYLVDKALRARATAPHARKLEEQRWALTGVPSHGAAQHA